MRERALGIPQMGKAASRWFDSDYAGMASLTVEILFTYAAYAYSAVTNEGGGPVEHRFAANEIVFEPSVTRLKIRNSWRANACCSSFRSASFQPSTCLAARPTVDQMPAFPEPGQNFGEAAVSSCSSTSQSKFGQATSRLHFRAQLGGSSPSFPTSRCVSYRRRSASEHVANACLDFDQSTAC